MVRPELLELLRQHVAQRPLGLGMRAELVARLREQPGRAHSALNWQGLVGIPQACVHRGVPTGGGDQGPGTRN